MLKSNIKTERQTFTFSKKAKIMKKFSSEKLALTKSLASQKGASNLISKLYWKITVFLSTNWSLQTLYIWDMEWIHQKLHIHAHVDNRSRWPTLYRWIRRWIHSLRHNELRDTFVTLLDEICHDIETSMVGRRKLSKQNRAWCCSSTERIILWHNNF